MTTRPSSDLTMLRRYVSGNPRIICPLPGPTGPMPPVPGKEFQILYSNGMSGISSTNKLWYNVDTDIFNAGDPGYVGRDQGGNNIAFGKGSGITQARYAIAIGSDAGVSAADDAVALGHSAGHQQGTSAIAIGASAGNQQDVASIAIGTGAASNTQGKNDIAIGSDAGASQTGNSAIAIGTSAGRLQDGKQVLAIGVAAGASQMGDYAIAIGVSAGASQNGDRAIAIGVSAGASQEGDRAIAIGVDAGANQVGSNQIAIGTGAGAQQSSSADESIAIGYHAGAQQTYSGSIALGSNAGANQQAPQVIAIGVGAGATQTGAHAIAIGQGAGGFQQGADCIAIGAQAGVTQTGDRAIYIGAGAGSNQGAGSIILNALGAAGATTDNGVGGFFVTPVNRTTQDTNYVVYNPSTKELVCNPAQVVQNPMNNPLDMGGNQIINAADIIPKTDNLYSLGSPTHRWKELFVGPDSVWIGAGSTSSEGSWGINSTNDDLTVTHGGDTATYYIMTNPNPWGTTGGATFTRLLQTTNGLNVQNGLTASGGSQFNDGVTVQTGDLTVQAGGLTVSGLVTASNGLYVTGGAITAAGGLEGTTGDFSGLLTAAGGLSAADLTSTTGTFSGLLSAAGGLTSTTGDFSGLITAENGISATNVYIDGKAALTQATGPIFAFGQTGGGTLTDVSDTTILSTTITPTVSNGKLSVMSALIVQGSTGNTVSSYLTVSHEGTTEQTNTITATFIGAGTLSLPQCYANTSGVVAANSDYTIQLVAYGTSGVTVVDSHLNVFANLG